MHHLLRRSVAFLGQEVMFTMRRPWRLVRLLSPARIMRWIRFNRVRWKATAGWEPDRTTGRLAVRSMESYDDYLELQASKLELVDLQAHEDRFRQVLRERTVDLEPAALGKTAICLGARLGAEVRALRDLGYFAVGVDLCPGENNAFVLFGDFHHLEFPDDSVDLVYTNSLDHALDLTRVLQEVARVLKPSGRFVVEADPGTKEADLGSDMWQTLSWERVDDLAQRIELAGWQLKGRRPFEYPRHGQQLVFRLQATSGASEAVT